jgi:uncharacterized membrane protein YraQ (UPF0718 family)
MLAGPILNGVVLFSTYVAFELHGYAWQMIAYRAGLGFLVACVTGLVVHAAERKYGVANLVKPVALPPKASPLTLPTVEGNGAPKKSFWTRLSNISETALHDFIDITVFLILGAVLAAVAKMYITPQEIARLSEEQPLLTIPAMMGLAILMCLCSEADAFVAASFTEMHFAPKLAFLVLGPMCDLKLMLMYTRVFRTRLIVTIVSCVIVQVLAYTMIVHAAGVNPASALSRAVSQAPTEGK